MQVGSIGRLKTVFFSETAGWVDLFNRESMA